MVGITEREVGQSEEANASGRDAGRSLSSTAFGLSGIEAWTRGPAAFEAEGPGSSLATRQSAPAGPRRFPRRWREGCGGRLEVLGR